MRISLNNLICAAILLTAVANAAEIKVGMTEAELLEAKGQPQSRASIGPKSIYRWPDMEAVVEDKAVSRITHVDPQQKQIEDEEREIMVAAQKKESDAKKAKDQEERIATARAIAAANSAAEKKRQEYEVAQKQYAKDRAVYDAKIATLTAEISRLSSEISAKRGLNLNTADLQAIVSAKQTERSALVQNAPKIPSLQR